MKKGLSLLLFFGILISFSLAEPIALKEDLSGVWSCPIGDTGKTYTYAYTYPQVDDSDPSAEAINGFYAYEASVATDFDIPLTVDYYTVNPPDKDVEVRKTYTVTCNNDDFLSVLLKTESDAPTVYTGHTFSRNELRKGSSVALPYLLGILETDETDTWLQDRQTAKADAFIRELVWSALQGRDGVAEDYTREIFDASFYPEEDFYLDETGNPVFYLEPGTAMDQSLGPVTFPITIEEILDEL